jgi:GLPGLI family protein
MKKAIILVMTMFAVILTSAQLMAPTLNWDESYNFDKCNSFKMEIYAKNNELMGTKQVKTYYQSNGENFAVKFMTDKKGNGMETVIDKKNEVAIQMFGTGGGATPMYNAGGFKYPEAKDLKKLEIVPTTETKQILGYTCKKYTYTYKKIFGEVWLTDQVSLSNDIGVFRACKMAAIHNTLSVNGFVMEMTTEDAGGGRTLMITVSLRIDEKYTYNFKGVEMTKAMNKVNYYTF